MPGFGGKPVNISDYVRKAREEQDLHRYDQWLFAWSAEAIAKRAAANGEIQRANIGFLVRRIIAEYEAQERERLETMRRTVNAAINALEHSPLWENWTPAERTEAVRLIKCGVGTLENIEAAIADWSKRAAATERKARHDQAAPVLRAIFEAEGRAHTTTWEPSWVTHEDSCGGLHGGDYVGGGSGPTEAFSDEMRPILDALDFPASLMGLQARLAAKERSR
jgi:hypothetical protein